MADFDPSGLTVVILNGEFSGQEGICLGRVPGDRELWAVSPTHSDRIVNLRFEDDFGVVINPGQPAGQN